MKGIDMAQQEGIVGQDVFQETTRNHGAQSWKGFVKRWAADAVSLSRVALLGPLAWLVVGRNPWALLVLAAIIASDLVDGPLARRLGAAGSRGAIIDAACDALVVVTVAAAAGFSDQRYGGLAWIMLMAFLSYGAFSLLIGRFAYTRLGRYDGTVSYGIIAAASAKPLLAGIGLSGVATAEWVFLGLSALVLAASTTENVAGIVAARERRQEIDG